MFKYLYFDTYVYNFKYTNFSTIFANKKYRERSPKIAKILDVKTMRGSLVTAKIAGTESKAKIMSLNSIKTRATNSEVIKNLPFSLIKKLFH